MRARRVRGPVARARPAAGVRDQKLPKGRPCEMCTQEDLDWKHGGKAFVPFTELSVAFAEYLNSVEEPHRAWLHAHF